MTIQPWDIDVAYLIIGLGILFAILGFVDRIFLIIGIFVEWLSGLYIGNNPELITSTQYNQTAQAIVTNFASSQETFMLILLMGLIGVANILILIRRS